MKKKKQKGNPNDLRTTVIRQKEPDILSIFIRYSRDLSLQPPFAEVLSGLLRAAYWPLVFSFSSFSGLFWPGPFSPFLASGFQTGAEELPRLGLLGLPARPSRRSP